MRESCHHFLPWVVASKAPRALYPPRACDRDGISVPGSGKPPKGFRPEAVADPSPFARWRLLLPRRPANRSVMNFVALKRKTMKTPPGRALEVSAR
jgi:hypothetical protein